MSGAGACYSGTLYRAHDPRWAFLPVSGAGAAKRGGRFNPAGVEALYLSERIETAFLEANSGFAFKSQPTLICAYCVELEGIIDLTGYTAASITNMAALDIRLADCACAWEDLAYSGVAVPSWTIAQNLIDRGYSGIRVRSYAHYAQPSDINLVLWRWTEKTVKVIDDFGRLPENQHSWSGDSTPKAPDPQ